VVRSRVPTRKMEGKVRERKQAIVQLTKCADSCLLDAVAIYRVADDQGLELDLNYPQTHRVDADI